jgi:dihydrofolate synthase/folylpolyglutamate synthase
MIYRLICLGNICSILVLNSCQSCLLHLNNSHKIGWNLAMVFLPHWPIPHGTKPINLGLDRVRELLARLNNPEVNLPPVIHVAGTNGKGSTLAYLQAILEKAGYSVHKYTSPHILRFNERIIVNGREISDDYLYEVTEKTRLAAKDLQTTFFEGTTCAAFLAFAQNKADVLLLETGMGGRLDATNVLSNPLQTIITPISDDHQEYLGNTIGMIAREKAGIIKPGVPCIINWQTKEAMDVLLEHCANASAPTYAQGISWDFETKDDGFNFIDLETEEGFSFPNPNLIGMHQIVNAAGVIASLRCLDGFDIGYQDIAYGLTHAKWHARLQKIENGVLFNMLPQGVELWVDGAHNNHGAQMIAAHIKNNWQDKPTFIINGRTGDRDIKTFLEHFIGISNTVCGVKVRSEPKGELAHNISNSANELGFHGIECESIQEAIIQILKLSNCPCRILVIGSLYLYGDIHLANHQTI